MLNKRIEVVNRYQTDKTQEAPFGVTDLSRTILSVTVPCLKPNLN